MSHSVSSHLTVTPADYDVEIRRFVPGYDAMLDEVAGALGEHLSTRAGHVLDLGAGTGALSALVCARLPDVRITLIDVDPAMLAQAEMRLASVRSRVELRVSSFDVELPACDAAVASLALHHVRTREAKRETYRNVFRALRPGGVLVNADAAMPAAAALSDPVRRRWASHLVANGDTEARAFERFAEWAEEDRYFGIDEELQMLGESGFTELDVRWRVGPSSVLIARRG